MHRTTTTATHIVRVVSGPPDRVSLPLTTANDRALSLRARGLLLYLMAQGDDARIDVAAIADECTEGRDAVYAAMAELKAAGYMRRTCRQGERGRMEWTTAVADDPAVLIAEALAVNAPPQTGAPFTADRETVDQDTVRQEVARTVRPGRRPAAAALPTRDVLSPSHSEDQDQPSEAIASSGPAALPPKTSQRSGAISSNEATAMVQALEEWQGYPVTSWPAETIGAKKLLGLGHGIDVVKRVWLGMKAEDFWADKHLGLQSVAKQIDARLTARRRVRPGSASRTAPPPDIEVATPEVVAARRAKLAAIMGRDR